MLKKVKNISEFEIRTFNILTDASATFFNYITSFYSNESDEEKNSKRLPMKDKESNNRIILLLTACIFLNYGDDINKLITNNKYDTQLSKLMNNFAIRYLNTSKYYINGNIFNDKFDVLSSIRNSIAHGAYIINNSKSSITIKDNLNRRYEVKIDDIVCISLLTALAVLEDDIENNKYGILLLKNNNSDKSASKDTKQYIKYILEQLDVYSVKLTGNNVSKTNNDIIYEISDLLQKYNVGTKARKLDLIKNIITSFLKSNDKYKDYTYKIKHQNIDIDNKLIDSIYDCIEKTPENKISSESVVNAVLNKLEEISAKYDDNVSALISTCVDNICSLNNINEGKKDYNELPDFETTSKIYKGNSPDEYIINNNLAIASALSLYSLFVYPFNYIRDDDGFFNYRALDFSLVHVIKRKNENYANSLEEEKISAIKACESNKAKMDYRYKKIQEECEKRNIMMPSLTKYTLNNPNVPIEIKNHLREYLKYEKEVKGLEYNKNKKIIRKEFSDSRRMLEGIRNSIVHGNYYIKEINGENVLVLYDILDNQNYNNFECYIKLSDINTIINSNKEVINNYLNEIKEVDTPKKVVSTKPYNEKKKNKKKTKKRK